MGEGLADGVTQGGAVPDEFRTTTSGALDNVSCSSMTDEPCGRSNPTAKPPHQAANSWMVG
jgi:hypothetical protein